MEELKILILEDNSADVDLLIREMTRSGMKFTSKVVKDRGSFEREIHDFTPDLILADYTLPSFNGAVAFQIKQDLLPDIPFIVVSGTIGEEKAVELIKSGVTDCVLKERLFGLPMKISRALRECDERAEKLSAFEVMREQHKNLTEIGLMQAHQVRRPVASIKGLISLINFFDPYDKINGEIIPRLKIAIDEFDAVIKDIVLKTEYSSVTKPNT